MQIVRSVHSKHSFGSMCFQSSCASYLSKAGTESFELAENVRADATAVVQVRMLGVSVYSSAVLSHDV